jgi:hypothetical protein
MVGKWELLLTCLKNNSKNNVKVAWYWNKEFLLLISLISRLFCSKGWSNYLVNWSDLFQKMVKLTLRLEWLERLEQVTKGQIYQPYLSTPGITWCIFQFSKLKTYFFGQITLTDIKLTFFWQTNHSLVPLHCQLTPAHGLPCPSKNHEDNFCQSYLGVVHKLR